jgi:DNA-binding response OmpR family regulator
MNKIIVVDDDHTNVGLTKMLLELDGFDVIACQDIEQAKAAAAPEISAFVVDVHLARGASGLELIRAVRAAETAASADAIIITASGDHRREEEARTAGADCFLLKPYSPADLSQEIHRLLAEGRAHV